MRVTFRVDASPAIGTGHFTRCTTLASALVARGAQVAFVCREDPGELARPLQALGGTVTFIDRTTDERADAAATLASDSDWIVVDHYELGLEWERAARGEGRRLLVVDDYWDRVHDCDLYLNQNYIRDDDPRLFARRSQPYDVLAGPSFALLRDVYPEARDVAVSKRGFPVERVLLTFGGSDQDDVTGWVLRALDAPEFDGLGLDVVVGAHNPNADAIARVVESRAGASLYVGLPDLAERMAAADLAICAGGSTIWELMCLGVPSIVLCIAENQRSASEALSGDGFIRYLGAWAELDEAGFRAAVSDAAADRAWVEGDRKRRMTLVDGKGAARIADRMI